MYGGERDTAGVGRRKRKIRSCTSAMLRPPRAENCFRVLSIGKIESNLHRTARIQTGARFSGKSRPLECRRLSERPVAPENSFRSPVSVRIGSLTSRKTMRSGNSVL